MIGDCHLCERDCFNSSSVIHGNSSCDSWQQFLWFPDSFNSFKPWRLINGCGRWSDFENPWEISWLRWRSPGWIDYQVLVWSLGWATIKICNQYAHQTPLTHINQHQNPSFISHFLSDYGITWSWGSYGSIFFILFPPVGWSVWLLSSPRHFLALSLLMIVNG